MFVGRKAKLAAGPHTRKQALPTDCIVGQKPASFGLDSKNILYRQSHLITGKRYFNHAFLYAFKRNQLNLLLTVTTQPDRRVQWQGRDEPAALRIVGLHRNVAVVQVYNPMGN